MIINIEDIKKVIPKYPQINGREDYIKTSVLVLLLKKNNDWSVILEKRAKNISQGGEISFAGGKFDALIDITAQDTAIREASEELGIDKNSINVIGELDSIFAPIGAVIKPFLGTSEVLESSLIYNKSEVEYIFSVPLIWFIKNPPIEYSTVIKAHPYILDKKENKKILLPAEELGLPKKYHHPWGNLKQKVFVYKYNNEIIWGLTARIINSLVKNLAQYIKL
jgi:8-oxo-dGTP pyrophosphatase MutT (NUDIX family)